MAANERIQKSLKKLTASNVGSKIKIRAKQTRIHGYSIYLDHFSNSKRSYEFIGLYLTGDSDHDSSAIAQAIEIRRMRETEMIGLTNGTTLSHWKRKSSVVDFISQRGKGKQRAWGCTAASLDKFKKGIRFCDLTPQMAEDFREYLLSNYKRNTAWSYLATLKAAVKIARREGIITSDPVSDVTISKQEIQKEFLQKEELQMLSATSCHFPELKRAFLFACYSGLRISDITLLDWKAIDCNSNQITLRMKKTRDMLYIPLLSEAKRILGEYGIGKVFDLPAKATMNRHLKLWAKDAGIEKRITFHTARHTFAIAAIDAGVEINVIQRLLGHRELGSTMVYAKVRDRALSNAADKIAAFFGKE